MTKEPKKRAETEAPKTPNGYALFEHTFQDRFKGEDVTYSFNFARPSRPQMDRVQKMMLKKKLAPAMKALCLDTIHPDDKASFLEALEEYTGLAGTFGDAILDSCGFGQLGN